MLGLNFDEIPFLQTDCVTNLCWDDKCSALANLANHHVGYNLRYFSLPEIHNYRIAERRISSQVFIQKRPQCRTFDIEVVMGRGEFVALSQIWVYRCVRTYQPQCMSGNRTWRKLVTEMFCSAIPGTRSTLASAQLEL